MELTPQIPKTDSSALAEAQERLQIENQLKSGANWYYWIGGLSIINSLIFLFNGTTYFVVGLGITQFVDGVMYGLTEAMGADTGMTLRLIGFVINLGIAGMFFLFGIFSRRKIRWVFILGIVLYALDTLLLIWAVDIFSILFHLVALFGLFKGLQAMKKLEAFEKPTVIS